MSDTLPRIDPTKPSGPIAYTSDVRSNDAALQAQIDTILGGALPYLPLDGGEVTGDLTVDGNLSALGGVQAGPLTGTSATLSGTISAASATLSSDVHSGGTISAGAATFTGPLTGTAATLSGTISAGAATFQNSVDLGLDSYANNFSAAHVTINTGGAEFGSPIAFSDGIQGIGMFMSASNALVFGPADAAGNMDGSSPYVQINGSDITQALFAYGDIGATGTINAKAATLTGLNANTAAAAAGSGADGDDVNIVAGMGDGNGRGGSMLLAAGAASSTNSVTGQGGNITLQGGYASTTNTGGGAAGLAQILGGRAYGTGSVGAGPVYITGGPNYSTSGNGGHIYIAGGLSTGGIGGNVQINGGGPSTGGNSGGNVMITPGVGAGSGRQSGYVLIQGAGVFSGATKGYFQLDATNFASVQFKALPTVDPAITDALFLSSNILMRSGFTKRTVTGSRGGNAALASLLTGLVALGLITDSTTA